jgi:hypothetical protein
MATGTRVWVDVDGYEYWSTWKRKEAETHYRGCPADVSQYVETSASGTCVSSRRTAFDTIVDARCRRRGLRAVFVWLVVISLVGCLIGWLVECSKIFGCSSIYVVLWPQCQ